MRMSNEYMRNYMRMKLRTDPKYKEKQKAYRKTDRCKAYYKAYWKAYQQTDKRKAYMKAYHLRRKKEIKIA